MRDSFVLYTQHFTQVKLLTMEQRGILLTAVMAYASGEEPPELDDITRMCFSFIQQQLDRDFQKYDETLERRRKAGSLGGQAKTSNAKQSQAMLSDAKQSQANQADNVNVNVNDNVNVNGSDNGSENENENVIQKRESKERKARFSPPTLTEVQEYVEEMGYQMDADRFMSYYESNGWMVGRNKMKDWRAAVRNWAKNDYSKQQTQDRSRSAVVEEWYRERQRMG